MAINISRSELFYAQTALVVAILLQVAVLWINNFLSTGPQYVLIATEIGLAVLLASTLNAHSEDRRNLQKLTAGGLLGFISLGNMITLLFVLYALIVEHTVVSGTELLASAIAIFLTNIIVYALWYWEIDSPGLTSKRWSRHDKDFQFTQQDKPEEFAGWRPEFIDYLYLSITNAINFAPADTRPVTRSAKMLMASQALISVTTLALVISRSVTILA